MELIKVLGLLAAVLPQAYGAPLETTNGLHPKMLAAMKRDLGLDPEQAAARIAREVSAADVIENLRTSSGDKFAGAWVANHGKEIHVAVTDEAMAKEVTAAGAKPTIMPNSLSKLREAKKSLDKLHKSNTKIKAFSTSNIASWHVDIVSNKVVLKALNGTTEAEEMAKQAGLTESEFEVQIVDEMPKTFANLRNGDAYIINNSARCSVGFMVTTGFVSAGHCGEQGASATTTSGEALGTFSNRVFPGDSDMSYISTVGGTNLIPWVNAYGTGDDQAIRGSNVAPYGSSICRSGSTSGVHCGTVYNTEVTVNYDVGPVTGLTQTDVCAEPGDSGGSFYSGDQAQGVTSGGSGDCTSGGQTFFQPVNEILSTYGLTLFPPWN